ncbi:hypothetical protein A6R68_09797, partial [Neotoma lepida]
ETATWGKGAYRAFNGRIFSFESSCAYTFCRDCAESGGDFNIEIKRHTNNEIEEIKAVIDDVGISVLNNTILVNNERVQVPYSNKMIHIKKQGEDINEHIANSKISNDCPSASSKNNEVCEDGVQYCDNIIGTYFEKCGKVSPLSSEYKKVCVDEYCRTGGGKNTTCDTFSELARLCAYDGPGVFEHWRDDSAVVCEEFAESNCGILLNSSGPFAACHQTVNPKFYYEDQNIILQDGKVTAVQTTENTDCERNGTLYSIHTVGLYLIVKLANGIILIWDKYTKVSVILDPKW